MQKSTCIHASVSLRSSLALACVSVFLLCFFVLCFISKNVSFIFHHLLPFSRWVGLQSSKDGTSFLFSFLSPFSPYCSLRHPVRHSSSLASPSYPGEEGE
uniref:Transmembrane protein n=1 Tax=Palpitomonas bilix TaxID=652834 RepID=A0A7S3G3G4_9EUKA|mmetsp:Transcript_15870/g.40204  ORF Transcript_15870/g.40204 Transcript_15870/m.40204 type:complete len:100 (+) Transcript_15870:170-469(+)